MRGVVVALCVLAGCAPEPIALVDARPATSYLTIALDPSSDRAVTIRAFEVGGDLDPPITLDAPPGALFVLAYDRPLAGLGVVVADDGTIAPAPREASPDEAWPLPPPERWWALRGATLEAGVGPLDVLGSFAVRRPPCEGQYSARPIALPETGDVTAAIPAGPGRVVFATAARPGGTIRLFRASAESGFEDELTGEPPFTETSTSRRLRAPLAFVDSGVGWIAWPARSSSAGVDRIELYPFRQGVVGPPLATTIPTGPTAAALHRIAAGTFGGQRTWVARDRQGHLWWLDQPILRWRRLAALGVAPELCGESDAPLVLLVDGDGTGIAGGQGQPLRRFDRSVPGGLREDEGLPRLGRFCRNVHARAEGGVELLGYETADDQVRGTLWRPPGGAWQELVTPAQVNAKAILGAGSEVWSSASDQTLVRFEVAPGRPMIPPRACPPIPTGVEPHAMVDLGDGRVFVGGDQVRAAFVERR